MSWGWPGPCPVAFTNTTQLPSLPFRCCCCGLLLCLAFFFLKTNCFCFYFIRSVRRFSFQQVWLQGRCVRWQFAGRRQFGDRLSVPIGSYALRVCRCLRWYRIRPCLRAGCRRCWFLLWKEACASHWHRCLRLRNRYIRLRTAHHLVAEYFCMAGNDAHSCKDTFTNVVAQCLGALLNTTAHTLSVLSITKSLDWERNLILSYYSP